MADPSESTKTSENPESSAEPASVTAPQEPSDATAAASGGAPDADPDETQAEELSTSGRTPGHLFGASRQRFSLASGIVGGLAGGALGILAAVSLPYLTGQPNKAEQALSGVELAAADMARLQEQLAELREVMPPQPDLSALEGAIAALEGKVSELDPEITEMQATTSDELSDLDARLATLFRRVEALEISSGDASLSQAAETEEQLARFKTQLDQFVADAEARIADLETRALEAGDASSAGNRFAIARLRAVVETGAPYFDVISTMEDVPSELADHARSGIPTLLMLQQEFPGAARASLAVSRSYAGDGTIRDRIVTFLRQATNARSLTPREGDSADAVLSRAEASVAEGDLLAALAELETLPHAARLAMADWIAKAEFRLAVLGAIDVLAGGMN
ncbi:MAG: mitofilin family membrane protein [Boseongicola sp.]|nr:mitofilin family membrane protein [Boseongicola sp.]